VPRLPQLILFDLDGTLVDTATEIAAAVNRTLQEEGLPQCTQSNITGWIGKGTGWLFGNALQEVTGDAAIRASDLYARLYPRFLHNYAEGTGQLSTLYPHTREALHQLATAGARLGVVTNKERSLTLRLLDAHHLTDAFEILVAGGDTAQGKPSPDPLLLALQKANLGAQDCLFVGDSRNDVEAARSAGISVWAFNHGYNHGEPIANAHPDAVLDSFTELLERLKLPQALSA
jgi:phosphoglycolate phosphatase